MCFEAYRTCVHRMTHYDALHSTLMRLGDLGWSRPLYVDLVSGVPAFDPRSADYVYLAVANHIAARIAAGELKSGDRLPGERDLAEEYGVALGTIRRATQELRDRGLARTVRVKGTFIV
jgi:regulatory GntR family protein